MGWDIVFHARFLQPQDPAQRFRAIRRALELRPGVEPLSSFKVLKDGDPLRPLVELSDVFPSKERVTDARVEACLSEMTSDSIGFCGAWETRRARGALLIRGAVIVTALGPSVKLPRINPPPVDVLWDVGDSRRYTREGKSDWPTVDELMTDITLLIEQGADSIWGLDADQIISPGNLYAVFHRDWDHYRHDRTEPFAPIAISEEAVRAAAEVRPELRTIETPAGLFIYHQDLAEGRLIRFYDALEGAVEYEAELQNG